MDAEAAGLKKGGERAQQMWQTHVRVDTIARKSVAQKFAHQERSVVGS